MKKKFNIINLFLSNLTILMITSSAHASIWTKEFYSQSVYLHKYKNPITQNKLSIVNERNSYDAYGGVWFEHDDKSDADITYTDAQVSPLLGVRSKVFGNPWMYNRFFLESRLIHRTKPFLDQRARTTYEVRGGLTGYGIKLWDEFYFLENYYAAFYTRLYSERIILEGWARQGLRFKKHWEIFNEFFADTFDLTRETDATYDLRPGVRFRWDLRGGSFQLIHQRLYHLTNLEFSGRNESRSTIVFGYYW